MCFIYLIRFHLSYTSVAADRASIFLVSVHACSWHVPPKSAIYNPLSRYGATYFPLPATRYPSNPFLPRPLGTHMTVESQGSCPVFLWNTAYFSTRYSIRYFCWQYFFVWILVVSVWGKTSRYLGFPLLQIQLLHFERVLFFIWCRCDTTCVHYSHNLFNYRLGRVCHNIVT